MFTVLLPPNVNPIAVKYIISYLSNYLINCCFVVSWTLFYGFSKLNLKGKSIVLLGEFANLRKAAENSSLHSEEFSAATCRKC